MNLTLGAILLWICCIALFHTAAERRAVKHPRQLMHKGKGRVASPTLKSPRSSHKAMERYSKSKLKMRRSKLPTTRKQPKQRKIRMQRIQKKRKIGKRNNIKRKRRTKLKRNNKNAKQKSLINNRRSKPRKIKNENKVSKNKGSYKPKRKYKNKKTKRSKNKGSYKSKRENRNKRTKSSKDKGRNKPKRKNKGRNKPNRKNKGRNKPKRKNSGRNKQKRKNKNRKRKGVRNQLLFTRAYQYDDIYTPNKFYDNLSKDTKTFEVKRPSTPYYSVNFTVLRWLDDAAILVVNTRSRSNYSLSTINPATDLISDFEILERCYNAAEDCIASSNGTCLQKMYRGNILGFLISKSSSYGWERCSDWSKVGYKVPNQLLTNKCNAVAADGQTGNPWCYVGNTSKYCFVECDLYYARKILTEESPSTVIELPNQNQLILTLINATQVNSVHANFSRNWDIINRCYDNNLRCVAVEIGECINREYASNVAYVLRNSQHTVTGKTCAPWKDSSLDEIYEHPSHNLCIDNGYKEGPWCYIDSSKNWELCYPNCGTACYDVELQCVAFGSGKCVNAVYSSNVVNAVINSRVSKTGKSCTPWKGTKYENLFEDPGQNTCLDNSYVDGPWCYVDENRNWELCFRNCEQGKFPIKESHVCTSYTRDANCDGSNDRDYQLNKLRIEASQYGCRLTYKVDTCVYRLNAEMIYKLQNNANK